MRMRGECVNEAAAVLSCEQFATNQREDCCNSAPLLFQMLLEHLNAFPVSPHESRFKIHSRWTYSAQLL